MRVTGPIKEHHFFELLLLLSLWLLMHIRWQNRLTVAVIDFLSDLVAYRESVRLDVKLAHNRIWEDHSRCRCTLVLLHYILNAFVELWPLRHVWLRVPQEPLFVS